MIIRATGKQWRQRMGDEFFSKISALRGVPVKIQGNHCQLLQCGFFSDT